MDGEKGKKKRFDRDFKISAVKMVTEGGQTAAEVGRSLGIHSTQIHNWKKKLGPRETRLFPAKGI